MLDSDGQLACKEVRIENTNSCNASCTICPRGEMTRSKIIMPNEHFFSLLWQVKKLGAEQVSIFGFGEPLMDAHIAFKVELAVEDCGLETHITTNASLLTQQMAKDLLSAGLSHIRFSVHALTPATFANVHRGLSWEAVTGNMAAFRKLNNTLGHPCTIHLTCIPQHGESVKDVRELWEPFGDYLEIWKPHNWGGKKEYRNGEGTKDCFRPFSGPVQIQADGNVIPCCFLTDGEVVLGNTYNHTVENILRGDAYRAFQQQHKENKLVNLPCGTCDQRFDSDESPLLYSNRDPDMEVNRLSTSKIKIRR